MNDPNELAPEQHFKLLGGDFLKVACTLRIVIEIFDLSQQL